MDYGIISAKDAIKQFIENEHKTKPIGFVYCEGSFAYQCMMDFENPGNYIMNRGLKFKSKFNKFERVSNTSGIMCQTETTCISVCLGNIEDMTVLFVYPTSQKVDHKEVKDYLTHYFPSTFFVEYDQNFSKETIERKLKDKVKLLLGL